MAVTAQSIKAMLDYIATMLEAITSCGEQGLPSGHLYAMVMGNLTIDQYQQVIDLMVQAGRVRVEGHVLYAIGRK